MVKSHYDLSNEQFERQFESRSLDASLFTHEAHLRLAYIHITNYGLKQAEKNISNQIKNYVAKLGAEDKYNETVTIAAIKAVYHFMKRSDAEIFPEFIKLHPQLIYNFKGLLMSHYTTDIFNSQLAKQQSIEAELAPFN